MRFLVWVSPVFLSYVSVCASPLSEKPLLVKALIDLSFPFLPKEMHQQCTTEMSLSWVLNLLFRFLCRLQFQYSRTTSKPFCRASYGGSGQRTAQPPPSRYWQWHRKHCSVKGAKTRFPFLTGKLTEPTVKSFSCRHGDLCAPQCRARSCAGEV